MDRQTDQEQGCSREPATGGIARRVHSLETDSGNFIAGGLLVHNCHHQTAQTFRDVMQRLPARIRFGVSATPDKTGDFEWALVVLGEVVHVTTRHELRELGFLVRPEIRVVDTGFDYPFHSTFKVSRAQTCRLPGCAKTKAHLHRNNYSSMTKALREDERRNDLIVSRILREAAHRQLVVGPQKGHLQRIARLVGERSAETPREFFLTGDESREWRREVVREIEAGPCVVYSTVAKEALDAPKLDRLHMVWPTRNVGVVRQWIGRVERAAEGKKDAVVYDYADRSQPVLAKQFAERRWGVYAPDLMRVTYD